MTDRIVFSEFVKPIELNFNYSSIKLTDKLQIPNNEETNANGLVKFDEVNVKNHTHCKLKYHEKMEQDICQNKNVSGDCTVKDTNKFIFYEFNELIIQYGINNNTFCVDLHELNKGKCECLNDSGSPGIMNDKLVSIKSFRDCKTNIYPIIYIKLSKYKNWITNVTNINFK